MTRGTVVNKIIFGLVPLDLWLSIAAVQCSNEQSKVLGKLVKKVN
jgi:hypothetical protein